MNKDYRSKRIDGAARRRALQSTLDKARARNDHLPPEHIEEIIDKALDGVRAERSGTRR